MSGIFQRACRGLKLAARRGARAAVLVAALLCPVQPAGAVPDLKRSDPALQRQVEAALSRQLEMVEAAVSRLAPQREGVRDVYFIGVAGWGDQNVFRNEVRHVRSQFERLFGAKDRAISLVNHPATLDRAPLATLATIEAAVMGVAETMDVEEDLLVMFLTSHGARWDGFSLVLNGNDLGRLRTAQLARILGASRIRNRVIIVSSCYAGQFVPALAEEHTLLITAAASDRASFGCEQRAEWTWFGEAFFREALDTHRRFQPAFQDAVRQIEAREKRAGHTPSVPQIRLGAGIAPVLEEMGL